MYVHSCIPLFINHGGSDMSAEDIVEALEKGDWHKLPDLD